MTQVACSGVLFDMDGTLVDSTAIVETAWGRFGAKYGLDPVVILAFSHGRQTIDTVTHFFPDLPQPERLDLVDELVSAEIALTDRIIEIPGAAALVEAVVAAGLPVALVTSAPRQLAIDRMHAAGVPVPGIDVPGEIVAAEDVPRGKPAPDCYLLAAERLGVSIDDCVVFEDAPAGVRAGVDAGATVVVVGGHLSDGARTSDGASDAVLRVPDLQAVRAHDRALEIA